MNLKSQSANKFRNKKKKNSVSLSLLPFHKTKQSSLKKKNSLKLSVCSFSINRFNLLIAISEYEQDSGHLLQCYLSVKGGFYQIKSCYYTNKFAVSLIHIQLMIIFESHVFSADLTASILLTLSTVGNMLTMSNDIKIISSSMYFLFIASMISSK